MIPFVGANLENWLRADFFERDTVTVARELLGKVLVRGLDGRLLWGRIVEVEAYCGPDDLAAHSSRGRTRRTEVMFGPPGHAYVYFIYGMYNCLNFVTQPEGIPQAVLIRALEPGPGVGRCSGPGLLCRALSIDRSLNGVPLEPPLLYVCDDGFQVSEIRVSTRVGVDYAGDWKHRPWRFFIDSPAVTKGPRAARSPRRPQSRAQAR